MHDTCISNIKNREISLMYRLVVFTTDDSYHLLFIALYIILKNVGFLFLYKDFSIGHTKTCMQYLPLAIKQPSSTNQSQTKKASFFIIYIHALLLNFRDADIKINVIQLSRTVAIFF